MTVRSDPQLLFDLRSYGEVNVDQCFNCGNCTAICPLSTDSDNFPRRLIRYAQLGLKERLISSKELWMCYACGECTQTCPRDAKPGEFMAASRRYAIANYDRTGLAKLLLGSPLWSFVVMFGLAAVIALFLFSGRGDMAFDSLRLFDFIPAPLIHDLGIAVLAVVFVAGLLGAVRMVRLTAKDNGFPAGTRLNWLGALWQALGLEALGQRRYRKGCETPEEQPKWYLRKWFVHASMMWGFLGLLAATILDYLLDILGIKPTGTPVPLWYPTRLLGSIAGLVLVYGVTVVMVWRARKANTSTRTSVYTDWAFLAMMWIAAVTGFLIEIALYLAQPPIWGYWMLLVHVVVAMELVLLAPFTKFAHVFYRTTALYMAALKPIPEKVPLPITQTN
ncbi:MAG: 4Fe-4S dicluster domain-containing protein [Anaerolineales bacterium]